MRILFLGDYSNLHACLATELKRRGHDVTIISDGGTYMQTEKDFCLSRKPGIIGGFKYLYELFSLLPHMKGYDVVQLINPNFLGLRPGKLRYFFNILKKNNGNIFLTLAGNDYFFVNACLNTDMFEFSEFRVGNELTEFEKTTHHGHLWTTPELRDYNSYVYDNIDGAMSVLPEYDMAARPLLGDRLAFTNLPIDLSGIEYAPSEYPDDKVNIFIGMRGGMEIQKGTAKLLNISRELERKFPELFKVTCVRNLSLKDYLNEMKKANIVLDQLYSYSPGTNALQAMAMGKVAGTGAMPEYYQYLGERNRPVFRLSPLEEAEIADKILYYAQNRELMAEAGLQSRALVEQYNDLQIVADKFESHWNKIVCSNG